MPMMRLGLMAGVMLLVGSPAFAGVALDACALRAASAYEPGYERIGVATIVDPGIAVTLCEKASRQEPGTEATAWLAHAYYAAGRYADALPLARQAADQGSMLAMFVAADIVLNGLTGEQQVEQGIALLRASAELGYAPAQNNYGFAYEVGEGVPLDPDEAMKWYLLAAAHGHPTAESNVGIHYRDGLGDLEVDHAQAVEWFTKAAEHGDAGGQDALGYAYDTGQGVPQDAEKAFYYYGLAAAQGDSNALGNLGYAYHVGNGTPQDYAKAMEYYRQADTNGSTWVASYIGNMYLDGAGVPQNIAEAKLWIDKGLAVGDYHATYLMGRIYEEGLGMTANVEVAKDWYRKAADLASAEAIAALERLDAAAP